MEPAGDKGKRGPGQEEGRHSGHLRLENSQVGVRNKGNNLQGE